MSPLSRCHVEFLRLQGQMMRNSTRPLLFLITVCAICTLLAEVKADIKGIPANKKFRKAQFPYARVLEGCTSWRRPDDLGDRWGAVSFRAACQAHDQCYHTLDATWGLCNQQFQRDLRDACERDLKQANLEQSNVNESDANKLSLCYQIADLYYAQVQKPDAVARFQIAQEQQKAYVAYVEEVISNIYQEVANRPSSQQEVEQAMSWLRSGHSLAELREVIRSQEQIALDSPSAAEQVHAGVGKAQPLDSESRNQKKPRPLAIDTTGKIVETPAPQPIASASPEVSN